MRHSLVPIAVLLLLSLVSQGRVFAQDAPPGGADEEQSNPGEIVIVDGKATIAGVEFTAGPCTGSFGDHSAIEVPEGLFFTGRPGAVQFMAFTQNPTGDSEVGLVLAPEENWFSLFRYEDSGHVKDDEKDELDADALLDAFKEGNEEGNKVRKKRGWETLELVGWYKPPFYDPKTNNLTWATIVRSQNGDTINWSTKLLGRTATMHVDLVVGPEEIEAALPKFDALIAGFQYTEGNRYAEFRQGDKLAEYGLTALVAGGAGVVAFKTGLFAKLWGFILKGGKFIILGLVGLFLALKKMLGFGKKETHETAGS